MNINTMKLTGESFSKESFRVIDGEDIMLEVVDCMLKGTGEYNVPIYIIRNFLSKEHCAEVKKQFYNIIEETAGGNRIENFVKVLQIGSTQFQKSTDEYFAECTKTKDHINRLIATIEDKEAVQNFILEDSMRQYYSERNIHFGPSSHKGLHCNLFTARLWNNSDDLLLLPHEDLAQLSVARKDDYEIGNVKNVIALNLCIENKYGSQLILWNISPEESVKKALQLETLGYPYPLASMEGVESLVLDTQPGDLYFINANYIHAVSKKKKNERISLGRFMGYASDDKVCYWT